MAERLLMTVHGPALTWAREVVGMPVEVAAAKIGVSATRLAEFESGAATPTINQLRNIARVYKKPTAFFFLRNLPPRPERIQDFRLLPEADAQPQPELLDAVEAAREKRRDALDLAALLGIAVPEFAVRARTDEQPNAIADRLRARLGVALEVQKSWREQYRVLNAWTAAIESSGVLVTQFSRVEVDTARGLSITDVPLPTIALNGSDYPRGKVFTLFHELAHIALGKSGVCDLHEGQARNDVLEPFCNRVAAETLVPAANFLTEPLITQHDDVEWEDWRIRELAETYGVSNEVIVRRLLVVGKTTEAFYNQKRDEYRAAYAAAAEEGGGFLQYFRRILRDNGRFFTGLVLGAYQADLVTPTEVSRLLGGVKFQHVARIQEALEPTGV